VYIFCYDPLIFPVCDTATLSLGVVLNLVNSLMATAEETSRVRLARK
jgi:hypothetical protein